MCYLNKPQACCSEKTFIGWRAGAQLERVYGGLGVCRDRVYACVAQQVKLWMCLIWFVCKSTCEFARMRKCSLKKMSACVLDVRESWLECVKLLHLGLGQSVSFEGERNRFPMLIPGWE